MTDRTFQETDKHKHILVQASHTRTHCLSKHEWGLIKQDVFIFHHFLVFEASTDLRCYINIAAIPKAPCSDGCSSLVCFSISSSVMAQEALWGCLRSPFKNAHLPHLNLLQPRSIMMFQIICGSQHELNVQNRSMRVFMIMSWKPPLCRTPLSRSCTLLPLKVSVFSIGRS